MYTETLFHGSNRLRGKQIIENQIMEPSRGDNHWLGDGSYFFTEDFHSYKWIVDMYKNRHSHTLNYENLTKFYLILKGNIKVKKSRIFDLTKTEHKILFDRVYKEIKDKRQLGDDFAEGIVINYMFNELPDYKEEFDVVKAVFILNKHKYEHVKTRIGFMPQEQLCIKNLEVVENIVEYDFKERTETFDLLLTDYYFEIHNTQKKPYNKRRSYDYNYKYKKKRSS